MMRELFTVAVFAAVLAVTRTGAACSCNAPPPAQQALRQADVVFHGTVTAIEPVTEPGTTATDPEGRLRVIFKVARVWKGDVAERFTMAAVSPHVGMCFFPFAVGEDYLIYANGGDGTAQTSLCSRSARVANNKPDGDFSTRLVNKKPDGDFAKLGPGKPPKPAPAQ